MMTRSAGDVKMNRIHAAAMIVTGVYNFAGYGRRDQKSPDQIYPGLFGKSSKSGYLERVKQADEAEAEYARQVEITRQAKEDKRLAIEGKQDASR